ncbi:MAG TPA: prolyl oligopeptidase family serine peptidase [Egibacteraceae bacterium]|nr:prolyl oligopeptidase family serine peptidase [Egibacteraceae bacterium]
MIRPRTTARSFPHQYARTRRFTLGHPKSFSLAADGARVAFLRAGAGDDPLQRLWVLDTESGAERCVADPAAIDAVDGDVPAEEAARRERAREQASGIVGYATDRDVATAAFALNGKLFVTDLVAGRTASLPVESGAIDPRPDPTGRLVAYVRRGALEIAALGRIGATGRRLVGEDLPDVTWGLAEFIAAEEMGRSRGFWWSPDGQRLAVARVDNAPVALWHISDPAEPTAAPATLRYPVAGGANADVSLWLVDLIGSRIRVEWDREAFPYLVRVLWRRTGPLTLLVQSRDQRVTRTLAVETVGGQTSLVREDRDAHWVEIVSGLPRWLPDERLLHAVDADGARRLAVNDELITPGGLHVRTVIHAGARHAIFTASGADPTAIAVWEASFDGGACRRLTAETGVHTAVANDRLLVVQSRSLSSPGMLTVLGPADGSQHRALASLAEEPVLKPNVELLTLGKRELRAALLLPRGFRADVDGPLPVLMDPYGGPHSQRVLQSSDGLLTSQWFADAGFAVLIVDGRGTPGRGPEWEREIAGDLAGPCLEDQIDALLAAVSKRSFLDLGRVAIRGWSFGGFLAAAALLRRPDVFRAAIAGAPVTDWRLYDTYYTERYLGQPDRAGEAYRCSSILGDARTQAGAQDEGRALLLIHGMADDNVVAAHTLRLSRALLEAGRIHSVLPLSAVTHMTPQEVVAERLLQFQMSFLRRELGLAAPQAPPGSAR